MSVIFRRGTEFQCPCTGTPDKPCVSGTGENCCSCRFSGKPSSIPFEVSRSFVGSKDFSDCASFSENQPFFVSSSLPGRNSANAISSPDNSFASAYSIYQ